MTSVSIVSNLLSVVISVMPGPNSVAIAQHADFSGKATNISAVSKAWSRPTT